MTEEFFWFQKSYGNTTRFKFLYTQFFFSVTAPGTFGRTDQKKIRYDERHSYIILWEQKNFCESKLLWAYYGLKFIFDRFFVFVSLNQKVASHWIVLVSMHKNWMKISKLVVCEVFKYIPSSEEDINFHMRIILIWKFIIKDFA